MVISNKPRKPVKKKLNDEKVNAIVEELFENVRKGHQVSQSSVNILSNDNYDGFKVNESLFSYENINRLCSGLPYPLSDEQYEIAKKIIKWIREECSMTLQYGKSAPFKRLSGYAGCIDLYSEIITNKGIMTLRKIISMVRDNYDFEGFLSFTHDLKVLSHDGTWNNITDVYATSPNTEGYHIVLNSGDDLKCSWKHPLYKMQDNGEYIWVKAIDLKVGDKISLYVNGKYISSEILMMNPIKQKFYDLTVKDKESFISNNIVSHNSGKSALISWLITEGFHYFPESIKMKSIAVCSFTWKAALVLQSRGIKDACSIHSIFYEIQGADDGKPYFTKRTREEVHSAYSLIIVDEASMVGKFMREDIEYFGVPVLYVGDAGQ